MPRSLKTSNQLQDIIVENFFNEVGSRIAFQSCSLVSKHWLHLSRTKYFSREKVFLTPQGGPLASPGDPKVGGLQKFLIESGSECPLWPYIRRIEIQDGTATQFFKNVSLETSNIHSSYNLALKALRCAQNLYSVFLWGFNIPQVQDKLVERIQSHSKLSTLHISHSILESGAFLRLLNSLGNRNLEIKLSGIGFDQSTDFILPSLGDLPTNPSLQFVINTYHKRSEHESTVVLFKLILRHRWNITALHLSDGVIYEETSCPLIPWVVQHIGSSLEQLTLPIVTFFDDDRVFIPPTSISLSKNTSLRKLRVDNILRHCRDQEKKGIVESLLSTIHSKERFSELAVEVWRDWLKDEAKEKVEWDSLEDILLDKERFPGSGPLLILGQGCGEAVPLDLVKNISFPRLAEADKLKSWIDEEPYW